MTEESWTYAGVCLYCEQPFTRTGPGSKLPDLPPRHCTPNHTKRYRLARRKCPTPDKRAFETVQEALNEWTEMATHRDHLPPLYVYRCACRRYHFTRRPGADKVGPLTHDLAPPLSR